MKRRLTIVSYNANRPFSPRGERTRVLAEAFSGRWDVDVIAPEGNANGEEGGSDRRAPALRRRARELAELFLLDKHELWSRRRFRGWRPDCDAALLIGFPFSPLSEAARRLTAAEIPYVVDAGDPWVLTGPGPNRFLGRWRAARTEQWLWERAAGAIVTTGGQARALSALFGDLRVLVRPNGYEPIAIDGERHVSSSRDVLRVAHFGSLYAARLDITAFLTALQRTGPWKNISLALFGTDWTGALESPPAGVTVERHQPIPWNEVVGHARGQDLALALGNWNPAQLPSKAVQYLTLPIPRVAVVRDSADEAALGEYVEGKPGWIVVALDDPAVGTRVADHVSRTWSATDLSPPPEESWPVVTEEIVAFVDECLSASRASARDTMVVS